MGLITIWSDLICPWSYVAAIRLHRTRDQLGADDVVFDFRAWPHDLVHDAPVPETRVRNEVAALAQVESRAFSSYDGNGWPSSSVTAFEAQKWGYSLSQDAGEHFDFALRRAFFLHSRNVESHPDLLEVAASEGLPADLLSEALANGRFRKEIVADVSDGERLGIPGSPHIEVADGGAQFNPGITSHWVRGIPILDADHPSVYEDIVRRAALGD